MYRQKQGWGHMDTSSQQQPAGDLYQHYQGASQKSDNEGSRSQAKTIKPLNSNFVPSSTSTTSSSASSFQNQPLQARFIPNSYITPQAHSSTNQQHYGISDKFQQNTLKSVEKLSISSGLYGENERGLYSQKQIGSLSSKPKIAQSISLYNQNGNSSTQNGNTSIQNGNLNQSHNNLSYQSENGSILNHSSFQRNTNHSLHHHKIQSSNPNNLSNLQQQVSSGSLSNTNNQNFNPGKLSIETTLDDNRPFSANNFTSYSATNSRAHIFGGKQSIISSVSKGGTMSTKFQEKSHLDSNPFHNSYKNVNLNLESQQLTPYSQQSHQPQKTNPQEQHGGNFQSQFQQQQIPQTLAHPARDESPAFKNKPKQFSVSPCSKKNVVNSMNLQEAVSQLKQQGELNRLTKSSQGQDLEKVLQQRQQGFLNSKDQSSSIQDINKRSMVYDQLKESVAKEPQNNEQEVIGKKDLLPNHEPTKCSFKRNGIVKAYAANTNQGLVRNYNEDRVSIILNIMKPASRVSEQWPKCSFFGVYDGHGGVNCADFLRDNLHQFVIKEPSFPWNPKEALKNGFNSAEKAFLELAQTQSDQIDRSGSCAIVILIVGDTCYVGNVGDSRAVLSGDGGQKVYTLSRDHKPADELEQKRIIQGGGKIYQTHATQVKQGTSDSKAQTQLVVGPLRVFPGRLSVSRTFGDIEAKLEKLGGNPNVVISEPEIKSFKITDDHDFIILASDGIYDKMSSKEVVQSVWNSSQEDSLSENVHKQCSASVESILRDALNKRSLDNVTVVMIGFQNYKDKLFSSSKQEKNFQGQELPLQQLQQQEKSTKLPLEEIKNFQPQLNEGISSLETPSGITKYSFLNSTTSGSKSSTAASSINYLGDLNKFDKDPRKSQTAMTPSYRASTGENQLRKKLKENQVYLHNENQQYQPSNNQYDQQNNQVNSGITTPSNMHQQFNKLRLLDQKISEISSKVNQYSAFDRKIASNNR